MEPFNPWPKGQVVVGCRYSLAFRPRVKSNEGNSALQTVRGNYWESLAAATAGEPTQNSWLPVLQTIAPSTMATP